MNLAAWLLALALHFAPPSKQPDWPGFEESIDETEARYAAIVSDIEKAVDGRKDARSIAALTLAWAIGESFLALDTDTLGECFHGAGHEMRCDFSRRLGRDQAATIWQIHEHRDRQTGERITLDMMRADRGLAARIAVRGLTAAWFACRHLPAQDRLSGWGIGRCVEGNRSVRARYKLWQAVMAWRPAE